MIRTTVAATIVAAVAVAGGERLNSRQLSESHHAQAAAIADLERRVAALESWRLAGAPASAVMTGGPDPFRAPDGLHASLVEGRVSSNRGGRAYVCVSLKVSNLTKRTIRSADLAVHCLDEGRSLVHVARYDYSRGVGSYALTIPDLAPGESFIVRPAIPAIDWPRVSHLIPRIDTAPHGRP
jgi:hypothetical protein